MIEKSIDSKTIVSVSKREKTGVGWTTIRTKESDTCRHEKKRRKHQFSEQNISLLYVR